MGSDDAAHFAKVADRLATSYSTASAAIQHVNSYELPSMKAVASILDQVRALLFPGFVGPSIGGSVGRLRAQVEERVHDLAFSLRVQLYRGLHHKADESKAGDLDCPTCSVKAAEITTSFLDGLVGLRDRLALDVQAFFDADPAAAGTDEIIFCYPGMYAITVYRIAHHLTQLGAKLIPRMMTELAHERVGIDIHPGASIGEAFFIDHGTGVVVGETTVIGNQVRLYQGVTLGAQTVLDRSSAGKRHPTLEDEVVVYAGATILGGDTVIGRSSVIGGNCWVTSSVPAGSVVTQNGVKLRRSQALPPVTQG